MSKLLVIKLKNNEEILGEVTETGIGYSVLNPIAIAVMKGPDGKPNIGFAPWPVYADTEKKNRTIDIDRASVLYSYEPAKDLDRKSTRLNSSHIPLSRMPSSA